MDMTLHYRSREKSEGHNKVHVGSKEESAILMNTVLVLVTMYKVRCHTMQ